MSTNNRLAAAVFLFFFAGCGKNLKSAKMAELFARDPYEQLAEKISYGHKYLSNNKVAVLPFSYTDKSLSSDGVVISERLLTLIINRRELEVIERGLLGQVLSELKLEHSGAIDENSLKGLGKILGVEAVVTGTLTRRRNGSIEVNARLIKTESAAVITAASATVVPDWETTAVPAARAPASPVQPGAAVTGRVYRRPASKADCPSGLVAYWGFNSKNIADEPYNSQLNGGPVWTAGKVGSALDFDGKDDFVSTSFNPAATLGQDFTVSAWIYPRSEGNYRGVAGGHGMTGINGFTFLQYTERGWVCDYGDGTSWGAPFNSVSLNLNSWSHVACVWAWGKGTKIYVNGALPSSANEVPRTRNIVHADYFWIGKAFDRWDRYFNGAIDELAIYNRALSAEEVQQQYQAGLDGNGPCIR